MTDISTTNPISAFDGSEKSPILQAGEFRHITPALGITSAPVVVPASGDHVPFYDASGAAIAKALAENISGLAWSSIPAMNDTFRLPHGCIYGTSGGLGLTQSRLNFLILSVGNSTTFTRIGIQVDGAVAASVIRLGVYDLITGALVLDAGTVSSATVGMKEIVISKNLTPGWYYIACICSDAGVIVSTVVGDSKVLSPNTGTYGSDPTGGAILGGYAAGTGSALPGTVPAFSVIVTVGSAQAPCMWIRKV